MAEYEVAFIANVNGGGHWECNGKEFAEWIDAVEFALALESEK